MIYSSKYSYIVLRVGLAAVFFWFGVMSFSSPAPFIEAVPPYLLGIFEILMGVSLITGVFSRFFALLGVLYLIAWMWFVGSSAIPGLGLIGGLLAIFLWPERR